MLVFLMLNHIVFSFLFRYRSTRLFPKRKNGKKESTGTQCGDMKRQGIFWFNGGNPLGGGRSFKKILAGCGSGASHYLCCPFGPVFLGKSQIF